MPRFMMVTVYDLADIRVELAKLTKKQGDYSRQRVRELIKKHLPTLNKTGGQYFLTDAELKELANKVQTYRRPKKY